VIKKARSVVGLVLFLNMASLTGSCSSSTRGECQYDTDCPGLEVCIGKKCVTIGPDAGPDEAAQDAGEDGSVSLDEGSLGDGDEATVQDEGTPESDGADGGGDESLANGEDDAYGDGGDVDVFSCPDSYVIPPGTVIIPIDGQDDLSSRNFDQAFDAPGNKIDSRTEVGQIKAWEFDNNAFLSGKITGTHGNYGQNLKDWFISVCPGDFNTNLSPKCRLIGYSDVTIYYHAFDPTKGCLLPPGQKMFLNIRANDPEMSVGYVVGNVPSATLP